jgi:hypothetical protein
MPDERADAHPALGETSAFIENLSLRKAARKQR